MNKKILLPVMMLFALCSCDKGNSSDLGLSVPKNAKTISNEKGLKALNGALETMSKYDAISFTSSLDKLAFSYAKAEMDSTQAIVASETIDAEIKDAKTKIAVKGLTSATSLNDMSASYTESATVALMQNGKSLFQQDELTLGYGVYLEESKCYVDYSNEAVKQLVALAGSNVTLPDKFYLDVVLPSDITFPLFNEEFFTQIETTIKGSIDTNIDAETLAAIQSVGEKLLGEFVSFKEYDNKYALVVEVTSEKILNVFDKLYEENVDTSTSSDVDYYALVRQSISEMLNGFDHIKLLLEFSSTGFLRSAMSAKFGFTFQNEVSTSGNVAMTSVNVEMAMSEELAYGDAVVVEKVSDKKDYQKYEMQ